MSGRVRRRGSPVAGMVLIVLGAALLADNFGFIQIDFRYILSTWWPMALVVAGLLRLGQGRSRPGWTLLLAGAGLQALLLGWVDTWTIRRWWPVILVALGIGLVLPALRGARTAGGE